MGHARCSFTCLISSITSERAEVLYRVVPAYQQHLRQEERHRQEAHPHSSCHYDSQEVDLVAGDFNGTAWRCRSRDNLSTIDDAFTDCALPTPPGPHTIVMTWMHTGQLGRRLRISQTTGFSSILGKCISMVHSPSHEKHSA